MPSPPALPLPSNSREGRALWVAAPTIVGISSTVSISMRVPPAESGRARTVAAARKGCRRRMRSDSARARSLQLAPTLRRSSRVIVDALVVVWNTPAARMKGLERAGKLTKDGATGLTSIAVTIVPSHGVAAAQTLGSPKTAAAMARRRAAEPQSCVSWRMSHPALGASCDGEAEEQEQQHHEHQEQKD